MNSNPTCPDRSVFFRVRQYYSHPSRAGWMLVLAGFTLFTPSVGAAGTVTWTPGGTDTNWSTAGNWVAGGGGSTPPAATDNVIFNNASASATITAISNVVDSTAGSFAGTIASLQYANTNSNFHNTLIAPGLTLNVTGIDTALNAFVVGTENITATGIGTATIAGSSGATLNVNSPSANFVVSQSAAASGAKSTLVMSNLDNFTANVSRLGIGVSGKYLWFNNNAQTYPNGVVYLAKTNIIKTTFQGGTGSGVPNAGYTSWTNVYAASSGREIQEAIEIGNGADNSASGVPSFLYLGQTNAFFIDSIGVGKSKSSAAGSTMLFNPVFASPVACFRGTNGTASRVSFWAIGDNATAGSTSNGAFGTNDFSAGIVDILADQMFLGIDKAGQTSASNPARGVLAFVSGIINVNTLTLGAQESSTAANLGPAVGIISVNGAGATLVVNSSLELGHTTLTANSALASFGLLGVTNGTVCANNIIVGAVSTNNTINLNNATLIVTNTLSTNAAGLANFYLANSTLGLTIPANGSMVGLVKTLNTGGSTNMIQIASVPVFASYPAQIVLVKYTTLGGAGYNFGFGANALPAAAPGGFLSNNVANGSIDLVLPNDPRPVITSEPSSFSGHPGDTVTLTVGVSGVSVTPLSYQWYSGSAPVTNGPTGNGSTLSGATTASLTITSAVTNDTGSYTVIVTNVYGAATSAPPATVTISPNDVGPSITGPSDQTVIQGNNATFAASVAGSPAPTVRWQRGGVDIPDATTTLVVTDVQYPADDQAVFSIIASNVVASVTNSATLTVIVPPTISGQPQDLVVTNTQAASFTVTAAGVPSPAYQWLKNNNPISTGVNPTATSATLFIAAASPSDMATYSVIVSNAAGTITSSAAALIVNSAGLAAATLVPANGATGICYDTPLYLTFSQSPVLNNLGRIRIYNAADPGTPVDTLDLLQGSPQSRSIGGVAINSYPVIITGNTAAIYPHSGVMTFNQTYYVTIDDGVFTDAAGAYFAGITNASTWQFTTKPTGPANPTNLVVAADGTGDFVTVQGAADFVPNANTNYTRINIRNGTYQEIVRLNSKNNVTFRGQDRHQTMVAYPNWNGINPSSSTRPMFGVLGANDVAIENLTLTNSTPNASGNNQAEALFVNTAKRFILYNADLDSYQDTLLVNQNNDQAYVQDSHVQGNTDFVWGQGTIYMTNAEIMFMPYQSAQDYLTQARTAQGNNGFAFVNCRLVSTNSGINNCYLGRDAGGTSYPYGQVAYINCTMDTNVVVPAGWALGSGTSLSQTANLRFWEYQSVDTNGFLVPTNARASWSRQIDAPAAADVQNVTNWFGGWLPQLAPNLLNQPASQSVSGGQPAAFTAAATGIPAPSYQWLKNGTNLDGQTNATLAIASAYAGDAGAYSVIVSNAAGVVVSSTATLTVANTAPTLDPIADQVINAGATLNVPSVADDPDVPTQTLSFSLLTGPANATIDANTGVFTWRPSVAQANTTNLVTILVADNGTPILTASRSFSVIVNAVTNPILGSVAYGGGQFTFVVVTGTVGPDYLVLTSTNLQSWEAVFTNNSPALPFTFTNANPAAEPNRFYRIQLAP